MKHGMPKGLTSSINLQPWSCIWIYSSVYFAEGQGVFPRAQALSTRSIYSFRTACFSPTRFRNRNTTSQQLGVLYPCWCWSRTGLAFIFEGGVEQKGLLIPSLLHLAQMLHCNIDLKQMLFCWFVSLMRLIDSCLRLENVALLNQDW